MRYVALMKKLNTPYEGPFDHKGGTRLEQYILREHFIRYLLDLFFKHWTF